MRASLVLSNIFMGIFLLLWVFPSYGSDVESLPYSFIHGVRVHDADLTVQYPGDEGRMREVVDLANQGDADACILMFRLYASGSIPQSERQYRKGLDFLEKGLAKNPNNSRLNMMLGGAYSDRNFAGLDENPEKAFAYYERAARNGQPRGYAAIGIAYVYGQGVAQDIEKAREYFKKAADAGDGESIMVIDNWDGFLEKYVKNHQKSD